jgi:hypothetical protein
MRKVLLFVVAGLMISSAAMADNISVYSDCTGASCELAVGFTSTAAVVHKFTTGATGSRFKCVLPAGSSFFSFATGFTPVGNLMTDLSVGYGTCLTGTICIGSIVAILNPGTLSTTAADGFASIIYTDCVFAEKPAFGGDAYVGTTGQCPLPTQQSTWGSVKALYR